MRPQLINTILALAFLPSTMCAAGEQKHQFENRRIVLEANVFPEDPFDKAYELNGKPQALQVRRGDVVRVVVSGTLKSRFHTYPVNLKGPNQAAYLSAYKLGPVDGLVAINTLVESTPELVKGIYEYHDSFTWSQDVVILPDAKPGKLAVPIRIRSQACDEKNCEPFTANLEISLEISSKEPIALSPDLAKQVQAVLTPPTPTQRPDTPDKNGNAALNGKAGLKEAGKPLSGTAAEYAATMNRLEARIVRGSSVQIGESSDLLGFILAGIFWGAISLITPCVFPMIPITVSFFLKQSEKEHHRPIQMALIYSATIVVVLTLAAAFLLSVFRSLSINPIMNYALGGLFIFFALSLFGMYDIELPSSLAQFTSSKEGQGGMVGTIFMALTFTIISFACVAPFLGGFGGTAAGTARPLWHNLIGGLAFSVTFASPFFFLALFPTLLRKMPKSGTWLNSVKVVMGFLEVAAAFKFFRSAELITASGAPSLFTFDLVLGVYVALCFLCGLYLLGMYRLPHDTPEENLGVLRMLFAGMFLTFGLYFLPALFKTGDHGVPQRPMGTLYAWVDSFLLPEALQGRELPSTANLTWAVNQAGASYGNNGRPKRVFVDFTGFTCTNCSLNENDVFPKPEIQKLLEDYIIVKLYTDKVPDQFYASGEKVDLERQLADADVNSAFQSKVFNTKQLPLYVILEPQAGDAIQVVGVYPEGRINDVNAFAQFLRDPAGAPR
ncbi:MAG: hypothetical protein HY040_12560 [Planctomycetes bacterium]|nr:hypothetical protein [Planctomycetota bacterium]